MGRYIRRHAPRCHQLLELSPMNDITLNDGAEDYISQFHIHKLRVLGLIMQTISRILVSPFNANLAHYSVYCRAASLGYEIVE